jgi:exodeoxyribonuclease VII small subunit
MTKARRSGIKSASDVNFEENLKRLQDIVASLSEGELPLREALSDYEEGMRLVKDSRRVLKESKAKVEKLNRLAGRLESFEPVNNEGQ